MVEEGGREADAFTRQSEHVEMGIRYISSPVAVTQLWCGTSTGRQATLSSFVKT